MSVQYPALLAVILLSTCACIGFPLAAVASVDGAGNRAVFPNPFIESTTFELTMPADARVSVVVYDAIGREMKRLVVDQWYPRGVFPILWNGNDESGNEVPPGVYICCLMMDGRIQNLVKVIKLGH